MAGGEGPATGWLSCTPMASGSIAGRSAARCFGRRRCTNVAAATTSTMVNGSGIATTMTSATVATSATVTTTAMTGMVVMTTTAMATAGIIMTTGITTGGITTRVASHESRVASHEKLSDVRGAPGTSGAFLSFQHTLLRHQKEPIPL